MFTGWKSNRFCFCLQIFGGPITCVQKLISQCIGEREIGVCMEDIKMSKNRNKIKMITFAYNLKIVQRIKDKELKICSKNIFYIFTNLIRIVR